MKHSGTCADSDTPQEELQNIHWEQGKWGRKKKCCEGFNHGAKKLNYYETVRGKTSVEDLL